jgi:hypothetical protein
MFSLIKAIPQKAARAVAHREKRRRIWVAQNTHDGSLTASASLKKLLAALNDGREPAHELRLSSSYANAAGKTRVHRGFVFRSMNDILARALTEIKFV